MKCQLDECEKEFKPNSWQQVFCSQKCRDRFHNRNRAKLTEIERAEDQMNGRDQMNGHSRHELATPKIDLAQLGAAREPMRRRA